MPDRRRTRPSNIHDAIALLRTEIAERETAIAVLIDLLARYPAAEDPRPRVGAPMPPTPPADDDANVVALPTRESSG